MKIRSHKELEVYKAAFALALELHQETKSFPPEERYSLTDQIRRSSRSVCANIAEAFRKRRYPKSFVSKLNDSESEAAETQVWLEFSASFGYLSIELSNSLIEKYDILLGKLLNMANHPEQWTP